jgi:hypothetical protein
LRYLLFFYHKSLLGHQLQICSLANLICPIQFLNSNQVGFTVIIIRIYAFYILHL